MQEKQTKSAFRMPMIELIIVIGVFALLSVFLVQMFMGTNRLQKRSTDISKALICTQTIAEQIKHTASIGETAEKFQMIAYDNTSLNYCIYYDKDWKQTSLPSDNLILVQSMITHEKTGRMVSAVIKAYTCTNVEHIQKEEPIVTITADKWVAND